MISKGYTFCGSDSSEFPDGAVDLPTFWTKNLEPRPGPVHAPVVRRWSRYQDVSVT